MEHRTDPTAQSVLLHRFKFLTLVQKIARMDLDQLISAVGLEAVAYRGTRPLSATLPPIRSAHRGMERKQQDNHRHELRLDPRKRHENGSPTAESRQQPDFSTIVAPRRSTRGRVGMVDDSQCRAPVNEGVRPPKSTEGSKKNKGENSPEHDDQGTSKSRGPSASVPQEVLKVAAQMLAMERRSRQHTPEDTPTKPEMVSTGIGMEHDSPKSNPVTIQDHVAPTLRKEGTPHHLSKLANNAVQSAPTVETVGVGVSPRGPPFHAKSFDEKKLQTENINSSPLSAPPPPWITSAPLPQKHSPLGLRREGEAHLGLQREKLDPRLSELMGAIEALLVDHDEIQQRTGETRVKPSEQLVHERLLIVAPKENEVGREDAATHLELELHRARAAVDRMLEAEEHMPTTPKVAIEKSEQVSIKRGEVPRAMVEEILKYRREEQEVVRCNERVWNTSNVASHTFVERLSNELLTDLVDEVVAEIGGALDDYVDGLAAYELQ